MKLQFLGQTYAQSQPNILTIASDNTACYRGRKYDLRKSVTAGRSPTLSRMSAAIYKYRGVSYVIEHY